jgi:hypothetical protein
MRNFLIAGMLLTALCGCNQPYNSPSNTDQYTATNYAPAGSANHADITSNAGPVGWSEAQVIVESEAKKCEADFKKRKLKTHYANNKCKIEAMRKYELPIFPNKLAFEDYATKRLLLAIRWDKKKIDKDEAAVLSQDLYNKLLAAENNTLAEIYAQDAAVQLARAQQDAARRQVWINALSSMSQSFAPPKTIHCQTNSGNTDCQY